MNGDERRALGALHFNWVQGPDDVWRSARFHVEGLHHSTARILLDGLSEAWHSQDASPVGVVVQGQRGSGKTHLLGWVRDQVQRQGGYFFLVGLLDARDFWESTVVSMLGDLAREGEKGRNQLKSFLVRLSVLLEVPRMVRRAVSGDTALTRESLDLFITALRRFQGLEGRESQDTARALVLLASDDLEAQDIGQSFLTSLPEEEPGERARWGIRQVHKSPQEIVRDVSRLLALTGPSVVAVDQIDTLIAQSQMSMDRTSWDSRSTLMIEQIAGGLMQLREVTRRTLTVLSCIPATWVYIEEAATDTVQDRFRQAVHLQTISDPEIGRALIAQRFGTRFNEIGFEPPYPTWPVAPSAFADAPDFTPRQLLKKIDAHIQWCLAIDEVKELDRLRGAVPDLVLPGPVVVPPVDLAAIDARFAELRGAAGVQDVVRAAMAVASEDAVMPGLLAAGLAAWIAGLGETGRVFAQDPPPSAKPPLHARLRRTLDETTEDEAHWAFRAISAENANAALSRIRGASVAAGLDAEVPKRRLFLLRNRPWSRGPRTLEAVAAFEKAGGRVLRLEPGDLALLAALRDLLAENPPNLQAWLTTRRPAAHVTFLGEALSDANADADADAADTSTDVAAAHADAPHAQAAVPADARHTLDAPAAEGVPAPVTAAVTAPLPGAPLPGSSSPGSSSGQAAAARPVLTAEPAVTNGPVASGGQVSTAGAVSAAGMVTTAGAAVTARPARTPAVAEAGPPPSGGVPYVEVGRVVDRGRGAAVGLEALRKHTAIFAGSGSGKTVLIRRLVEECALKGVSAIVLDPNNDLARLGDPWPEPPEHWQDGDAARAKEYLEGTDVVIWTPGRDAGRPLSFRPLPDFASVLDDADEFNEAVEAAYASLAPRAKLETKTNKAHLGQAVLREALRHYGRSGGNDLPGLIALLADLPEGVSRLDNAEKLAAELAQTLEAARVIDPLFGGYGTPVDPGVLLTPPPGRRARVSVISLVGLPGEAQRQSFVNQLQLALFAWIKKHPAGDRPLGGLFVMDEAQTFAPSGGMTACTRSTLALASQARKYGLGLVFATQAPKGLHNQIPGNAATQFYGLLNSVAQIDAAHQLARGKGGGVEDISKLPTGRFYAALEGAAFVKIQVPMCLSHHPRAPLTTEEVLRRARGLS
ncbi:hypothetical protein Misp01_50500 [Microtetraspora sp. NBRC 13810]|uniref:ATP-binding protein n=1 Tax=Microtetraspora sp. NBRC 13810 TaxID=3030990 RepID=UPI00249FDEE5|nr:DUF87 domain-containing protein [Microtetraspora sp. NBRC 13810]GLW09921.1 hypothetical protein Misp01_50500 [Microtetraspora sp. NBRC 13810]